MITIPNWLRRFGAWRAVAVRNPALKLNGFVGADGKDRLGALCIGKINGSQMGGVLYVYESAAQVLANQPAYEIPVTLSSAPRGFVDVDIAAAFGMLWAGGLTPSDGTMQVNNLSLVFAETLTRAQED